MSIVIDFGRAVLNHFIALGFMLRLIYHVLDINDRGLVNNDV
jgi:hypothetical protein